MLRLILTITVGTAFTSGCSRIEVRELPSFAAAMQDSGPKRPRLFYDNQVDWDSMPSLVPYAVIVVQRGAGVSVDHVTRQVWWKAQELKADAVRIIRHAYGFDDPAILEFGASLTENWQDVVASEYGMLGICLRVVPAKLDLRTDESGSLLEISPQLEEQQVEKWDRLIAVNDVPVDRSNRLRSRHLVEIIKARPAHGLKLAWERPGSGIREMTLTPGPNSGFPPDVADSLPWKERVKHDSNATPRR